MNAKRVHRKPKPDPQIFSRFLKDVSNSVPRLYPLKRKSLCPYHYWESLERIHYATPEEMQVCMDKAKASEIKKSGSGYASALFSLLLLIILSYSFYLMYQSYLENEPKPVVCKLRIDPNFPSLIWYNYVTMKNEMASVKCPRRNAVIQCNVYPREVFEKARLEENSPFVHAYLFNAYELNEDFPLPRNSTIWGLYNPESPKDVPEITYEETLNLFNFSATFSRYSDVPFTLFGLKSLPAINDLKHYVNTSMKNSFLKDIAPVLYLQSDCETSTERDDYVKELMKHIDVDSYGACLNNKDLPAQFVDRTDVLNNDGEFPKFFARYKFVIVIENAVCMDYITDVFWRAIELGVVPIYYGAPNIKNWLPNEKSAILIDSYKTAKSLSNYLKELLSNDLKYEKHLEHKTENFLANRYLFDEIVSKPYQFNQTLLLEEFYCKICDKIYENGFVYNFTAYTPNGTELVVANEYNITKKNHDNSTVQSRVNLTHYDCPLPKSVLTKKVNLNSRWVKHLQSAKTFVTEAYKKVQTSNEKKPKKHINITENLSPFYEPPEPSPIINITGPSRNFRNYYLSILYDDSEDLFHQNEFDVNDDKDSNANGTDLKILK